MPDLLKPPSRSSRSLQAGRQAVRRCSTSCMWACADLASVPAVIVFDAAGGQWQLITEEQEVNMASAATISDFLKEGFRQ